jgi:DNA (cytosine-5)-methyltransferase 1
LLGASQNPKSSEHLLYDHCSLKLNDDDYQRVSRIPKRKVFSSAIHLMKYLLYYIFIRILVFSICTLYIYVLYLILYQGANFRDLPGVRVRPDKKVEWDPDVERIYLDSGKPLVAFLSNISFMAIILSHFGLISLILYLYV